MRYSGNFQDFFDFLKAKLREGLPKEIKQGIMRGASAPMGFCSKHVNRLKVLVAETKCAQKQTNNLAYGIVFCALVLLGESPWLYIECYGVHRHRTQHALDTGSASAG